MNLALKEEDGFIRIPIWGHIPISQTLKTIFSHPSFFRLKGIKQLSFSHYVFPGATHTRFEHSIGVYHLTRLILQRLSASSLAKSLQTKSFTFDEKNSNLILISSLLHDIGHYPHAHLVECLTFRNGQLPIFEYHQDMTRRRLIEKDRDGKTLSDIIYDGLKVNPSEVIDMVEGKKSLPFSKLISGTLDPDKMDYLIRDAHHCNVPYGGIDIWRLIESFVPDPKRKRFAITEKGIAPFESLMFTKYMMMRNVYWHHTVRAFSSMLKRSVMDALDYGISPAFLRENFYSSSDERSLWKLYLSLEEKTNAKPTQELISSVIERTPYKRAIEIPLENDTPHWLSFIMSSIENKKKVELAILEYLKKKHKLDLKGNEVIIDPPMAKSVFDYDDFQEMQLYQYSKVNKKGRYVPFNKAATSAFKSNFILEFAASTKKAIVFAKKDIVPYVIKNEKAILDIIVESKKV